MKWVVEASLVYEVKTKNIRKSLETMSFPSFPTVDNAVDTGDLVEFCGNNNTATELDDNFYRVYSEFTYIVDTDDIEEAIENMEFCDYQYGEAEYIEGITNYYQDSKEVA